MSISTNITAPKMYWDSNKAIPHTCSVCGFLLRDDRDFETAKKTSTCCECADIYYYPNIDAWESGWRPNLRGKNESK